MIVAVASGKGGTGKTTVAANLAVALRQAGRQVQLLDSDVEEPNCHLLLDPEIQQSSPVTVPVPVVDPQRCRHHGECARLCRYGAILCLNGRTQVFPELCHACGGCALLCPEKAIEEQPREIGCLDQGDAGGVSFVQGRLKVGEPRAVPVIEALRQRTARDGIVLIDAPPGASCPVMAAIKACDFVCLVAESTPFGLHDLDLTVALTRALGLPTGVVVNRAGLGDDRVYRYCQKEDIPVLAQIPDDRRLAAAQAEGRLAIHAVPDLRDAFLSLAEAIEQRVAP